MKKIIIILLALSAVLAASCGKFLDTGLDIKADSESLATNRGSIWSFANAFYFIICYNQF